MNRQAETWEPSAPTSSQLPRAPLILGAQRALLTQQGPEKALGEI